VPAMHTSTAAQLTRFGLGALAFLSSCQRPDPGGTRPASSSTQPTAGSERAKAAPPIEDESVEIPGGAFFAGSTPGTPGRLPELEPRRYRVELGPFQIDRLPYPNDPKKPPLTGVTRDDARKLCAERGARLCTELEWERACSGPQSDLFPSGTSWNERCTSAPTECASGFDVLSLGGNLREWVASERRTESKSDPLAILRGASASEPAPAHRCARRASLDDATKSEDLGFRCCKGAPNAAVVPEPALGVTFERANLSADKLTELLKAAPETKALAQNVKYFREPDAANTVVNRGPGERKGFFFTVAPLVWRPSEGVAFLVVVARSGEDTSFALVYHVLGAGEYALASSFVMKNEPGPVALAYNGYIRPRLHFSTCWGCPGETGKILFREPETASILQP
jgi:formylglycine-generating enzyme required for sulfatase activity